MRSGVVKRSGVGVRSGVVVVRSRGWSAVVVRSDVVLWSCSAEWCSGVVMRNGVAVMGCRVVLWC